MPGLLTRRTARLLATVGLLGILSGQAFAQLELDRPVPPGTKPPVTVFTRVADAGTAVDYPDQDYIIVLDKSVNRVMNSGVTYVDHHSIYKVLTEEGVKLKSAMRWDYDPQSSFIEVAEVNIIRDGEKIAVSLDDLQDLPAPQRSIYWSNRIKLLQLPRLQVNDAIEIKAMRKGYNYALLAGEEGGAAMGAHQLISEPGDSIYIPPMPKHYFDIVLFQADVPVVEKKYILSLPKGKRLQSEIYNAPLFSKIEYVADSTYYIWWGKDMPAITHEARQVDAPDFAPKVVMTTAESWGQKSRWFYDVNRNQFDVTPDITAKVNQILHDAKVTKGTDIEKAEALNHWVAQNIRYSGQTMGDGEGFTLHPSDMLFEYRSGVCKDIASMSITFIRAAGLSAYPAMTMAGSRIEDIPADQFNHCVVAFEYEPDKFMMMDPTWVPFNNDVWSKLETEQHYVIGTDKGVDLGQIRYSPPEESPLLVSNKARLENDGTLRGTVRIDGTGACDSRLRRIVYHHQLKDFAHTIAEIMSVAGNDLEINNAKHRVVDNFDGDMWIEFDYTIRNYALDVNNGLEFTAPMINVVKDHGYLFRAGAADWDKERETDIFLYYTQRLDVTEEITLPRGFKLASNVDVNDVDEMYAAFENSVKTKGHKLILHSRTDVRRRQIPPAGYAGFRSALDALDDFAGTTLRVSKGGAK